MTDHRIRRNNTEGGASSRANSSSVNRLLSSLNNRNSINQNRVRTQLGNLGNRSGGQRSNSQLETKTYSTSNTPRNHISDNRTQVSRTGMRSGFRSNSNNQNRSLSRDSIVNMLIDTNGDQQISLEEILLYVIKLKSKGQAIPDSLRRVHPKFNDVVMSLELLDTSGNLDIEDSEAVQGLLKNRAGLLDSNVDPMVANFVLEYLNENSEQIKEAVEFIDTKPDAIISNLEVLTTLLASRKGEVDLTDPYIDMVLRTNDQYESLVTLFATMTFNFDGTVTDAQAFNILLALRGGASEGDVLEQALFLGTNENIAALEQSVALFDHEQDGVISEEEFISIIMDMRAGNIAESEHQLAVDILKTREPYLSIFQVIAAIDSIEDGSITNDEVIDFSLASLRGDIVLDAAQIDKVINSNSSVDLIRELIGRVDTEAANQGEITNQEFLTAITELLTDSSIGANSKALIQKIIAKNPNSAEILAVLNFIDKNKNNIIGTEEVIKAILADYKNETSSFDAAIYDMALDLNSQKVEIKELIDRINPAKDGNPSLDEMLAFVLDFKNGDISHDEALVRAVIESFPDASKILETYELMNPLGGDIDLREYTVALMKINRGEATNPGPEIMAQFTELVENADLVNEAITTLDTVVVDGLVSTEEFLLNFNNLFLRADSSVDMAKLNIFLSVSDLIYADSAALSQFINDVDTTVETPVNIISDTEVIDAFFNLNNHSITDPGTDIVNVVLSQNPNKTALASLVQAIDADHDGEISNLELTTNLLKFRRNEFSEEPGLIQHILNKNPNYNEINALVSAFDRDADGAVEDIELFAELFANRTSIYPGLSQTESDAIIAELKNTNPNSAAITNLVNSLDPDGSGDVDYDELVAVFLSINAGSQADFSDELKTAIPGIGANGLAADQLVDLVDSETRDGQISDIEIAKLILADRAVGTLASYDAQLVDAIFASNGNRIRIEAILSQLDSSGNGEIERAEVISAILDQRLDSSTFGTDYPLVEAILTNQNPEFAQIQSIINAIDIDGLGTISNQEVMNTLVKQAQNTLTGTDAEIANDIIAENTEKDAIQTALTESGIDLNSSSLTVDLFSLWVEIQQGTKTFNYFNELVTALGMTNDFGTLTTQFQEIDTSGNNIISKSEYGQLMLDIITGDKVQADYQLLINILASDPNLAGIKNIVDSFNQDNDNNISDQNILEGLLAIRRNGDLGLMSEDFITTILASNPDSATIIKILDITDPTQTGSFDPAHLSQVFSTIVLNKNSAWYDPAYDFNNDGIISDNEHANFINFYDNIVGNELFEVSHIA
ncbi:MAG: hypothetical protein HOA17_07545 [Candidatus Melainabacteria bacterium]|nr:hypothetical protein [Candidatus Melainabacteria bacterium]